MPKSFKKVFKMSLERGFKKFINSSWAPLALPFAALYATGLFLRRLVTKKLKEYDSVCVISVGNVDMGGTGKTPTLLTFLEHFPSKSMAVLTRGYKSELEHKGSLKVNHLLKDPKASSLIGDEPTLILSKFPQVDLYVGKHREIGFNQAVNEGRKIVFLEDGAQFLKIKKDFEVIVVDPQEPVKPLCPAGYRRDLLATLKKCDLVVIPYVDSNIEYEECKQKLKRYTDAKTVGLQALLHIPSSHSKVALIAAIARPERLLRQLKERGFEIESVQLLDDHACFSESVLSEFLKSSEGLNRLCTEKDWVKLPDSVKTLISPIKLTLKPTYDLQNWESFIGKIEKIS